MVHYLFYGKNEGRIFKSNYEDFKFAKYSHKDINNILSALNSEKIVILLYIYNDFEDTERCITSILENTNINYELILIDDCSTDRRVNSLLTKFKSVNDIKVIKNSKKLGYSKSVNLEIKNSKGDILLIKSNVVVTSRWLEELLVAAYSDEKIGTVIPLSNSDKFLSNIIADTTGFKQLKPDATAFLIESVSEHSKPEIVHHDESCVYIKREIINDIGVFDDEIDDLKRMDSFYQKIMDNGWKNIIDDSTYVQLNIESDNEDRLISPELSPQFRGIVKNIKLKAHDVGFNIPKKTFYMSYMKMPMV